MSQAKRKLEKHEAENDDKISIKRYKKAKEAIDSSADELVCPLTLELPIDPVMADDGKVYERTAIEEHIAKKGSDLKSPVTNEPMGKRLLPALQVRNVIEKLVDSGAIDGDKATRWKEELENRKEVESLREKAESGNTNAMWSLAARYRFGNGVKQDLSLAYSWNQKAADGGNVKGTAMAGESLVFGDGVDRNIVLGMVLIGRAEAAGWNVASFWLGIWFCMGALGLPRNPAQGKKFLSKVVNGTCKYKHLSKACIETASKLLQDLDNQVVLSQCLRRSPLIGVRDVELSEL